MIPTPIIWDGHDFFITQNTFVYMTFKSFKPNESQENYLEFILYILGIPIIDCIPHNPL